MFLTRRGTRILGSIGVAVIGGLAFSTTGIAGPVSIDGTYELVSRELPDGTMQVPPAIMGLVTFADGHRNFNVYWTKEDGSTFSLSMISTYEISESTYSETCKYLLVNDGEKSPEYELSTVAGTAAVSKKGQRIEFDLPLFNEPIVVFEGDRLTATREGEFVDHWVKVK
jgi:hypothetical protein